MSDQMEGFDSDRDGNYVFSINSEVCWNIADITFTIEADGASGFLRLRSDQIETPLMQLRRRDLVTQLNRLQEPIIIRGKFVNHNLLVTKNKIERRDFRLSIAEVHQAKSETTQWGAGSEVFEFQKAVVTSL